MAFRFSLEAVLRLRSILEEKEQVSLRALLARGLDIQQGIRQMEENRARLKHFRQDKAAGGWLPAPELQIAELGVQHCESLLASLGSELAVLEKEIAQQRAVLVESSRARRVVESVRRQQEQAYRAGAERRAQAELEQAHLLLWRAPGGARVAGPASSSP
jgi:flagellar export protein FliJ